MVNYQDGKIYQLINDVNSKVYIGSTCQTLCKRMSCHRSYGKGLINKSPIYLAMHDIGVEHFRIILIQEAPCKNKEELLAIEYDVARRYQQRGTILYNATGMATISDGIRAKMRKSQCTKGSVRQDGYSVGSSWRFYWREDGKLKCKLFSVKKYGHEGSRGLALFHQEEMYPVEREDDS